MYFADMGCVRTWRKLASLRHCFDTVYCTTVDVLVAGLLFCDVNWT